MPKILVCTKIVLNLVVHTLISGWDTLECVMANLQLADNAMADQDKFFKVTQPNLT